MNVCFFDFVHHFGGGQRSTVEMLDRVKSMGYDVHVVDPHGECTEYGDFLRNKEVKIKVLKPIKGTAIGNKGKVRRAIKLLKYLPVYISLIAGLHQYIKQNNIALAWTNSFKGLYILLLASVFTKSKTGLFIRGAGVYTNISLLKKVLIKYFVNRIMVQSNGIRKELGKLGINEDKIFVIANAVSIEELKQKALSNNSSIYVTGKLNILLPATIIREKGISEAIKAISLLKEQGVSTLLFLAGDYIDYDGSSYIGELRESIKKLDLENDVIFLGYRSDVLALMTQVDMVILPSYSEGMPRSIMEAMALGRPVIVTNVGAVPELVQHGDTGLLIVPRSEVALKEAIEIMSDIQVREKLSTNALTFIEANYSINNQKEQFKAVLGTV